MDKGGCAAGWRQGVLLASLLLCPLWALAGLPEFIDHLDGERRGDCWQVDVALSAAFLPATHFPDRASRYFYVLGQVAPGAGDATYLSGREQRRMPLGADAGILRVMYVGDLPGLKLLVFETDAPMRYRLIGQGGRNGLTVVFSPGGGLEHCPSTK
jgi:hypothetical protein